MSFRSPAKCPQRVDKYHDGMLQGSGLKLLKAMLFKTNSCSHIASKVARYLGMETPALEWFELECPGVSNRAS